MFFLDKMKIWSWESIKIKNQSLFGGNIPLFSKIKISQAYSKNQENKNEPTQQTPKQQ